MSNNQLLVKKVKKLTVKDLRKALKDADDDSDVVLTFYMKDEGLYSVYLAEIYTNIGIDAVLKESLMDSRVCELAGFNHKECEYDDIE